MANHQESKVSEYLLIESLWNLTMKQISQLSLMEKNMSNKKVNPKDEAMHCPIFSSYHRCTLPLMAGYEISYEVLPVLFQILLTNTLRIFYYFI